MQQQHCGRPVGGRFQDQDRDSWEGMKLGQFEGTDGRKTQRRSNGETSLVIRPKGRSGGPNGPLEKTWSTLERLC